MKWYTNVVLMCISLIISDLEQHFVYLLAICMSIQVLCPFLNQPNFYFLLLNPMCSLYILEINPLWSVWFANTFFPFCRLPFTLLIASFAVRKSHNFWQRWCTWRRLCSVQCQSQTREYCVTPLTWHIY